MGPVIEDKKKQSPGQDLLKKGLQDMEYKRRSGFLLALNIQQAAQGFTEGIGFISCRCLHDQFTKGHIAVD